MFVDFAVLASAACEYGMYDHSDTTNSYLLGEGWVPMTSTELSGAYKDDFIEFFNTNDGLESLLTWESSNCCFQYSDLTDTRITLATNGQSDCHVYPGTGTSFSCNPSGGYPQGTKYTFYSTSACHNGQNYIDFITANNVTFGTTSICNTANNPGIWRRCGTTGTLFWTWLRKTFFIFYFCLNTP